MTDQKFRAVLVGCGGISGAWMNAPALHENAQIVGVVDLNREAAMAFRDRHGMAQDLVIGTDLEAVLDNTAPQVVFDLTVPQAHCEVTCKALAKGCHVLGEKPMASSLAEARRMVAAAREAGKIYAVTQTRRFLPQARRLQRFLESGAIGSVHTVHADFFISARFGGFREQMQHVLLLDMAIHSLDLGRLLTPGNPVRVVADDWNPAGSWYRHGASAWAAFVMDGGQRFTYRGSWAATGEQTSWECAWRILGDQGAVTWDGHDTFHAQRVVNLQQPGARDGGPLIRDMENLEVPPIHSATVRRGHDGAIHEFFTALREGRSPETVCHDNIHSLAMVLGAIQSSEKGAQPIDISTETT